MRALSNVLSVVFSEDFDHLVVVLLCLLDVIAHAVDCLLDVVVGVEDAVLEVEAARVPMLGIHGFKGPKDLVALTLLALHDLLVVRKAVRNVPLRVALLRCRCQVLRLHFLEGVAETDKEVIHPILGDVCGRLALDLGVVYGLDTVEPLIVVLVEHLLEHLLAQPVACRVHLIYYNFNSSQGLGVLGFWGFGVLEQSQLVAFLFWDLLSLHLIVLELRPNPLEL